MHPVVKSKTDSPPVRPRKEPVRPRKDLRRQLLIYLKPEIIKDLKHAAIGEGKHAYVLAEEAILEFLKGQKRRK